MKLDIQNISCGYAGKAIVQDLSFSISSGEILCILGPNGVGKTTLFKTILGFLSPLSGDMFWNGQRVQTWSSRQRALHFGYVPQSHIPPFPFQTIEVVSMGRTAHLGTFASPSRQDMEESYAALETLGIAHLAERVYTELSGGERQLVLVARALCQRPDLLVMDEPTSNLDFGNQFRVLQQVCALRDKGMAVIMTTHVPDQVFQCDAQVVFLYPGREFSYGPAEQVVTRETLRRAYALEVQIAQPMLDSGEEVRVCVPVSR
ncbi:MAG TPA: ABC transporter ATP-binding protein [Fibrobacteraceae bacterium]|nr:ABC transporter ATP-binding protein [Fibrobacteraceae bacterium]